IGILFQETPADLFHQTVFEYSSSGRYPHASHFENRENLQIIEQALLDMDLLHLNRQLVHTLSGGERRRLNIATVLAQTPRIYLLDEPNNHLDIRYQIQVFEHFKKLSKESAISVVMALHDLRLAKKYCDKIILLSGTGE